MNAHQRRTQRRSWRKRWRGLRDAHYELRMYMEQQLRRLDLACRLDKELLDRACEVRLSALGSGPPIKWYRLELEHPQYVAKVKL